MAEESKVEQAPPTGSGQAPGDELAALRQALSERENRLKQLETESETASAKLETQATELAGLKETLGKVAVRYRQILLSGSPEIPEELVKGETVEEIEASFKQAQTVVERVRRELEGKQQRERVPAGAPPRVPMDVSAMSPQEKIAYALRRGG